VYTGRSRHIEVIKEYRKTDDGIISSFLLSRLLLLLPAPFMSGRMYFKRLLQIANGLSMMLRAVGLNRSLARARDERRASSVAPISNPSGLPEDGGCAAVFQDIVSQ
jgi:hypothetical protein